jgi:exonuclease SbcD
MPKILHFADAHIDMANYGQHDPESGLPVRVMDFLKSLDKIVDTAIDEKVDLVIFAGDAFKDRSPAPTFQREWGRRIMRLSRAEIPTLLLVGNHDISPAMGRAHAMDSYDTLEVPFVRVLEKPDLITAEQLGLDLQVIAIPWISRAGMMAHLDLSGSDIQSVYDELEGKLKNLVDTWLDKHVDPKLPVVLTAHATVEGATYGGERLVALGKDMGLSGSFVRDQRLDYVALGHIHKPQNLNEGEHPPVIYPGSIERVDFGEAEEDKFFIIADVQKGKTEIEWRQLDHIRPFIQRRVKLEDAEAAQETIMAALPAPEALEGAIVRLILDYPREWEALIDETAIHNHCEAAFEFRLVKRPEMETRIRLDEDETIGSLTPEELLVKYWQTMHVEADEAELLQAMAREILTPEDGP